MISKKECNNEILKRYEQDKQWDKKRARNQLKDFINKLDALEIDYTKEENTEMLWIEIDMKNVLKEDELNKLLENRDINFTIKRNQNIIRCIDTPVHNSY